MKKIIILLLLSLLILPTAVAKTGHMYLLSVSDIENKEGNLANLYLRIKPGEGNIYLDTFPLTQIDTQMSTRLAKEIACEFLEKDCSDKDFFYTIRADSPLVGGPSAGAAIATLTAAMLEDAPINESIIVTGTINSGGIIGPVGGIETKILVAKQHNISKVLVPDIEISKDNNTNKSIVGNTSVEIVEVSNLAESLTEFTGKDYSKEYPELIVDEEYTEIMKKVAETMCNRTGKLSEKVISSNLTSERGFEKAVNLSKDASKSISNKKFYPAASYCFGANIELQHILTKELTGKELLMRANNLNSEINEFEGQVESMEVLTISDLQTKIIVKERLLDAKNEMEKSIDDINSNTSRYNLAYATERFYSASGWSLFFEMEGKEIDLDQETIKNSCMNRISEAEERYQYVRVIIPGAKLNESKSELNQAYEYLNSQEYEMCLFKASQVKADIDIMLSVMGIEEGGLKNLIDAKLGAAKKQIAEEASKGYFPILGYSYYLYANDLKETSPLSAAIYSELSLELSNMWPYFSKTMAETESLETPNLMVFAYGLLSGIALSLIIIGVKRKGK